MIRKMMDYTLPQIIEDRLVKLRSLADQLDDNDAAYEICVVMFGEHEPVKTFLAFCVDTLQAELEQLLADNRLN